MQAWRSARGAFPPPLAQPGCSACQIKFQSAKIHSSNFMMLFAPPLIISPPAAPHIPQGRPQIILNFAFGTSFAAFFRFGADFFRLLVDFWMPQKSYKKRLQKNMPQNLQSRAPDRQNVDFGIDFGTLLASFFHQFFDSLIKCANHQNAFVHSSSVA